MSFRWFIYGRNANSEPTATPVSFATRPPDMLCFWRACAVYLRNNSKLRWNGSQGGEKPNEVIIAGDFVEVFYRVKKQRDGGLQQRYAVHAKLDLNRLVYLSEPVQAGTG